ncbi:MAG: MarR family transcriptional regulator [Armatimonadetes bacterium]|nr:MarR family transcriptional regulator [Armatimonadota bacterium]
MPSDIKIESLRTFLQAAAQFLRAVARALDDGGYVSLEAYDVLVSLEYAEGHRLRLSQLADDVVLSRSGLSRLVDRLEKQGYLRRESCPGDRRGTYAVLTDLGRAERLRAWPTVEAQIVKYWDKAVSDAEATRVMNTFGKMKLLLMFPNAGSPRK